MVLLLDVCSVAEGRFLRAQDIFPTLRILASLPGKNSRLRRSDSFPGWRSAAVAGCPEKSQIAHTEHPSQRLFSFF
jgi:hypothetical protein